jgi:hypothetical protein
MFRHFVLPILLLLLACAASVPAQSSDPWDTFPSPSGRRQREEDRIIRELMAKQQSEREKKEYAQLVERAETAEKLAAEIEKVFEAKGDISTDENKKLDEIQRLILKIRDGLGGSDDDSDRLQSDDEPKSKPDAVRKLLDTVGSLAAEVKRSTRYSISVAAIESANTALKLLKFLKIKN